MAVEDTITLASPSATKMWLIFPQIASLLPINTLLLRSSLLITTIFSIILPIFRPVWLLSC